MKRRNFIYQSAFTVLGLSVLPSLFSCRNLYLAVHSEKYHTLLFNLLKDWCDGMIKMQMIDPSNPKIHGLLQCPGCDIIHARCFDAVYPFLYMAKATGDKKYLDAGIAVFEWSENVTRSDGAWTNDLDPNSWDGTTVFGAAALAEALKFHGDLLDDERRGRWMDRLQKAAEFNYTKFDRIDKTNINYGATCIYVFKLLGEVLDEPKYLTRSKELAEAVKAYFTEPNTFLHGEISDRDRLSEKGLHGIDLGYNVEESLNSLIMYSLEENDKELLDLATKSMDTHLEFMLPDGGWDNSWGTRMFKWTYWGSRTSDGSQPCLSLLADRNPAFGTAAVKYTELLKQCTSDGLLHGGLHYVSHGIKPCIHHTFVKAKPLAALLEHWDSVPEVNTDTPLPRAIADGIYYYEEIDTSLFARGDWRGTITAYDAVYNTSKDLQHGAGGALSLLYHNKVKLLCTASMPVYKLGEPYNQQEAPGEDIALTPRIETYKNGVWYSNIFDLAASYTSSDKAGEISFLAKVKLKNEKHVEVKGTASDFDINYRCTAERILIHAKTSNFISESTKFVLPIISTTGEKVSQVSETEITIHKPEGLVKVSANTPLKIKDMPKSRTFNMVPGVEALPVLAEFEHGSELYIKIEVV